MATLEGGLGGVVAKHYDNLPEKGKEQRKDSRIFHMRNFNNWIKSTLINEYMEKIKYSQADDYRCKVLDIGKQQILNILRVLNLNLNFTLSLWEGRGPAEVAEVRGCSRGWCRHRSHQY